MNTLTSTMQASMRRAGLIAGRGLLVMSILAGLATFGVLNRLVTVGDASSTTSQILGAFGAFWLAILALFLIAVLDLVVAWALWAFFDRVHHVVAIAAACCRGAYAAIFAVAISHLLAAARLLGDQQPGGLADRQLHLEVLSEVERFYDLEHWPGPVRIPLTAHRLVGLHIKIRPAIHRCPGCDRRRWLSHRQPRRPALREVHLRARLSHFYR